MCLITDAPIKITTQDELVYKVVDPTTDPNKFTSYFRGFRYTLGERYDRSSRLIGRVVPWLHVSLKYEGGYHYFLTLAEAKRNKYSGTIIECTIPKGTQYVDDWEKKRGVANSIIINKVVK